MTTQHFKSNINKGEIIDEKTKGSFNILYEFVWDRSLVKKAIMTLPYNATHGSMNKYLIEVLHHIEYDVINKTNWYSANSDSLKLRNNDNYTRLLVSCLRNIILYDFEKIKKLTKYLKNVASIFNALELPISWSLPSGLKVIQSYMKTKTTSITPFLYSKAKLKFNVTLKDKFDNNKQIRALMPNLIHSLDATS